MHFWSSYFQFRLLKTDWHSIQKILLSPSISSFPVVNKVEYLKNMNMNVNELIYLKISWFPLFSPATWLTVCFANGICWQDVVYFMRQERLTEIPSTERLRGARLGTVERKKSSPPCSAKSVTSKVRANALSPANGLVIGQQCLLQPTIENNGRFLSHFELRALHPFITSFRRIIITIKSNAILI